MGDPQIGEQARHAQILGLVAFETRLVGKCASDPTLARAARPGEVLPEEDDCGVSALYGRMEIVLGGRSRVIVDATVDAPALARMLAVLGPR